MLSVQYDFKVLNIIYFQRNEAFIELNNYPFLDNKLEFTPTSMASDVMRPRLDLL